VSDTSTPTLSLVIPAYNRGHLIAQTLDSALAQDPPFLETIVVDDGSTDDTATVLQAYTGRVRVITLSNGGVQHARNTGVAAARGNYVALCDSDDLLEPGYVATMLDWLGKHPECDAVYTNFVTFDCNGIHPDKFSGAPKNYFENATRTGAFWHDIPDLYVRTVSYQALFPSGCVLRKSLYMQLGGYDIRFNRVGAEDWEFTLRMTATGRIALCAEPLVRVRKHEGNDSGDNIHTVRGTVHILEYALAQHSAAAKYRDAILASIDERRLDVFNGAFARGNFDVAADMLSRLKRMPRDGKFKLKAAITRMPAFIRQPLWRISQ
jgi:glycosyltransferase involved in cell wall biosynthesis